MINKEQPSTGLLMWVNELGGVATEVSEEGKATDARLMIVTSLCIDRLDPNPGCLCCEYWSTMKVEYFTSCLFSLYLYPGDQLTMVELVRFRGRERRINIPQQIGINFKKFGIILLEDESGAKIDSFAREYRDNSEQINMKVLQEWIAGQGKQPVSWDTLIEVLEDIGLGVLASDIAAVKC